MPAAAAPPRSLAFFLHGFEMGGAQRMTLALAGALASAGTRVDLAVADTGGPLAGSVPDGVRVVPVAGALARLSGKRRNRVRLSVPGLAAHLRRERPELLLAAANHASLATIWAHMLAGVPETTLVLRATNPLGRDGGSTLKRLAAQRFFPRADALVAVSPAVAADHAFAIPELADRIETIPEPVLDAGYRDRLAQPWTGPLPAGDGPLILAIGRLVPQKDYPTLLRALAHLRGPLATPARLLVLGDGAERAALAAMTAELGLDDAVTFAGTVANPLPALRHAACLALSSRWEGLGIVVVEAMAAGVPVVATDCDGPRFILEDRFGPLVTPGSPEAFAEALRRALAAPVPASALRARAADFTMEAVLPAYLDLFARLRTRG